MLPREANASRNPTSSPRLRARLEDAIDKFIHSSRDGADIEQRLDPLASGPRELGAPIGRVDEGGEPGGDACPVLRIDRDGARTADFGEAAQA